MESVTTPGTVYLFINGERSRGGGEYIDSGDIGKKIRWFVCSKDFSTSNHFVLKGDVIDESHVDFDEIGLRITYYSGEPALDITKTVSKPTINVGETATVTIRAENIGSNVADDISYTDTLPTGL